MICEKLCPHSHKWRDIGVGLGFTSSELDIIQAAPLRLHNAPWSAMLADWLEWAPGDGRGSTEYANIIIFPQESSGQSWTWPHSTRIVAIVNFLEQSCTCLIAFYHILLIL